MALIDAREWQSALRSSLTPIMDLIYDDGVTEIEVNGFDKVYVKGPKFRGHHLVETVRDRNGNQVRVGWKDRSAFLTAMKGIAIASGRIIKEDSPLFDGRLPDGSRVNMGHPPVNADGYLVIRKFPKIPMTLDRLESFGALDKKTRRILELLVLTKRTTLVAGGTESGKTSLLNALSGVIPNTERIVVVEDATELQLSQPNIVYMETLRPWQEGVKPVTMAHLGVNTLRQTPDRIIFGEVRDEAALQMLNLFNTGHSGGMTTIHANSAKEALGRLELLSQFAGTSLTETGICKLIASAIDAVVFLQKLKDGSKKIVQVVEVEPEIRFEGGHAAFKTRELVRYEQRRLEHGEDGSIARVHGEWILVEEPSRRLQDALEFEGYKWPTE